jgi:hypothetical protein
VAVVTTCPMTLDAWETVSCARRSRLTASTTWPGDASPRAARTAMTAIAPENAAA